ncbi:TPA: DUF4102 domain-containing protein [Vibrio parahaemolyticus]|nr:DUF4102 domain-containing protein [Vibrio parahaemolyticus]HCG5287095.1 DUF4102 domain-containing protein [Vibrio parahaemolyticus]
MFYKCIEIPTRLSVLKAMLENDDELREGIYKASADKSNILIEKSKFKISYLTVGKPALLAKNLRDIANIDFSLVVTLGEGIDLEEAKKRSLLVHTAFKNNHVLPSFAVIKKTKTLEKNFSVTLVKNLVKRFSDLGKTGCYNVSYTLKDSTPNVTTTYLRLSSKGSSSYFLRYKLQHSSTFDLGDASQTTLEKAKEYALRVQEIVKSGRKPTKASVFANEVEGVPTLRDLHLISLNAKVKNKPKEESTKTAENAIFKVIETRTGYADQPFTAITESDVYETHARITQEMKEERDPQSKKEFTGLTADKVVHRFSALIKIGNKILTRQAHEKQVKKGKATSLAEVYSYNPASGFTSFNTPNGNGWRKNKYTNKNELGNMFKALWVMRRFRNTKKDSSDTVRNSKARVRGFCYQSYFYEFLLYTGFRPQDAYKITWDQVNLEHMFIEFNDPYRSLFQGDAYEKMMKPVKLPKNVAHLKYDLFLYLNRQAARVIKVMYKIRNHNLHRIKVPFRNKIEALELEMAEQGFSVKRAEQLKKLKKELDEALAAYPDYVFINSTHKSHIKENLNTFSSKAFEIFGIDMTAGIPRATFQNIGRHAAGLGVTSYDISRLVFHTVKSSSTQDGYVGFDPDLLRQKSQIIADLIDEFAFGDEDAVTTVMLNPLLMKKIKSLIDVDLHNKINNGLSNAELVVRALESFAYLVKYNKATDGLREINDMLNTSESKTILWSASE